MKKSGWYRGSINDNWNDTLRHQLVYYVLLETRRGSYPINLLDKQKVYESILIEILGRNYPLPGRRMTYKERKNIKRITLRSMGPPNTRKTMVLSNRKSIRKFIRVFRNLKKVKRPNLVNNYIRAESWYLDIPYRQHGYDLNRHFAIMKLEDKSLLIFGQNTFLLPENLIEYWAKIKD